MLSYRKEVDGIRGLAVLLVIFFHFRIPWMQAGFTGVDMFFVVSGYLIGSIIINDLEANRFSFSKFYERRIRRIIPALYTVILACLLFSFLYMDSGFLKDLGNTSAATVLFISNLLFYRSTNGYFKEESGEQALLHTWSLSVEEQFYILFPLALYLLYKYWKKYIPHIFILLSFLSLAASIFISPKNQLFAFYMPVTRAWELLAGFFLINPGFDRTRRIIKETVSLAGIALIIAGLIIIGPDTHFPGYHALFPVIGTALILLYGRDRSLLVHEIFSFPPLVLIGKMSYSLYLWHWPIKIFSDYFLYDPFDWRNIVLLLLITAVVSFLSWRFIETPFRRKEGIISNRRKLFLAFAIASLLLTGVSIYVITGDGFPGRSKDNRMLSEVSNARLWPKVWKYNWYARNLPVQDSLPVIGNADNPREFLLWGDSHASMMVAAFEAAGNEKGISGYLANVVYGAPVLGDNRPIRYSRFNLAEINAAILRFIARHSEIKTVFLSARWVGYQQETVGKGDVPFEEGLSRLITALQNLDKKIILIHPIPELAGMPRKYLFQSRFFKRDINSLTPIASDYFKKNKSLLDFFDQLGHRPHVFTLAVDKPFFKNNKTILLENDHLLYSDINHWSPWGALKIKDLIGKSFQYQPAVSGLSGLADSTRFTP